MEQRGFAVNAIPTADHPGVYAIDVFIEGYNDGALSSIEMRSREIVEFDNAWISEIPDMQFIFTMLEVASQIIGRTSGPDDVETFRNAIAQAVGALEKTSLDD